jgi:phospholipase/carboxylesterase
MALDAVASGRWHLAAVVGFAGRLCSPEPLLPATETAVSIIHGAADPVVPEAEGQKAAVALRRHGVRVERHVVDGELHGITRDGAEIAASFLHRALQNPPAPRKLPLLAGNSSRSGQRHQGTPGR